jgi:UDP-N-acetylmuramoylalanine--D-glutamate ligase
VLDVHGKSVVVVGLGKSGVAAARACANLGARVVCNDAKSREALGEIVDRLEAEGMSVVCGGHAGAGIERADLVVVSPGVPTFSELEAAERAGIPIWGEVELATRALAHAAPIVAIGGTNGKSTVTSLVGALLASDGRRVFVGGNLGDPLADRAGEEFDAIVLEVSSFQMERVDQFRPAVSVLLNVTPDHLDRYVDMQAYAHAKGNAFARQTPDDVAVVPVGDAVCSAQARRGHATTVTFGAGGDFDVTSDAIVDRATGERYERRSIALAGGHNALNVAAALAAVRKFDVRPADVRRVLGEFRGLPHRTAFVAEIDGVRYYHDSKGTNVGAAVSALDGLGEPRGVLIAGGRDKGGAYDPLVAALRQKGRAAVLLGEAADRIAHAIGDAVPIVRVRTMDDAVRQSARLAVRGDAVLLSPACSSFDMFRDYKHRGDEFVRAVRELAEERAR